MDRSFIVFFVLAVLLLQPVSSGAQVLTQRDWLINLVNGLGWSFGLPDSPTDQDYLTIVGGVRYLHLEAEDHIRREDKVSLKKHLAFGDFSGASWVSGIASTTTAHIDFLLPVSGRYQLRARLRLPGHRFRIGGIELSTDGKRRFETITVGQVDLVAGPNVIEIELPPNGAIDYVELQAPSYPAIEPAGGWRLDQPITRADMAATVIRALQLHAVLPPEGKAVTLEAEKIRDEAGATDITDTRLLGAASGGRWVRARGQQTTTVFKFIPPKAGIYRLQLRGTGPVAVRLDDGARQSILFAPYLEPRLMGTFSLSYRPHRLECVFEPRTGIDSLVLQPLSTTPKSFDNLAGLEIVDPPTPRDLDQTLNLLTLFMTQR